MNLAKTIRENRATVLAAALVSMLLVGLFLAFGPHLAGGGELVALVHDADGTIHELPLNEDAQLTVTTSLGTNTVAVKDGAVSMLDADCPNRTCLQVQPLSQPGQQIICLPHQLWIEVVPKGEAGNALDVTRAEDLGDDIDLQAR